MFPKDQRICVSQSLCTLLPLLELSRLLIFWLVVVQPPSALSSLVVEAFPDPLSSISLTRGSAGPLILSGLTSIIALPMLGCSSLCEWLSFLCKASCLGQELTSIVLDRNFLNKCLLNDYSHGKCPLGRDDRNLSGVFIKRTMPRIFHASILFSVS